MAISKKIQERRLKWYEHVRWREEDLITQKVMLMRCEGREEEDSQENHR